MLGITRRSQWIQRVDVNELNLRPAIRAIRDVPEHKQRSRKYLAREKGCDNVEDSCSSELYSSLPWGLHTRQNTLGWVAGQSSVEWLVAAMGGSRRHVTFLDQNDI